MNELALADTWNTALANITADLAPSSAKRYISRLTTFRQFMDGKQLDKAALGEFKRHLLAEGKSASTVNGFLVAVRHLLDELVKAGYLQPGEAFYMASVKGAKSRGVRLGNWLTVRQANALLRAPDLSTLKGRRDKAILAVLVMCGLRRSELASLTIAHIQQRDGHTVFADIMGKGSKVRTVKVPVPVKRVIDAWLGARIQNLSPGAPLFRSMRKGDILNGSAMSSQAIYDLVRQYGKAIDVEIAAHDLRRTFAKLCNKGGAPLEAIGHALGHESLETTQRYFGLELDLDNAASDYLKQIKL